MRPHDVGRAAMVLLAALPLLAGCEFGKKSIGVGREQVVVHGVLDPSQSSATILVEQLLTGRVDIDDSQPFDPADPIVSNGGIPISGARVTVTSSSGESTDAIESIVSRGDGKGAGVYRIRNGSPSPPQPGWLSLTPGASYTLRVETPEGSVVTGATTIPSSQPARVNTSAQLFNRDEDSLFVRWDDTPLAHRYSVRVETPRGPLMVFVDSLEYLLAGTVRNIFTEGLPATFVPGFVQTVTVGAVDQNYYDYYRSRNDIFTGRGLINHLHGGIGLFGSYVMLRGQQLRVVADADEPVEAPWQRFAGPVGRSPVVFYLWLESPGQSIRQVSGYWIGDGSGVQHGLLGTLSADARLTVALLRDQVATDTVDVMELRVDDLAITGTLRSSGERLDYRKVIVP